MLLNKYSCEVAFYIRPYINAWYFKIYYQINKFKKNHGHGL